jgi:hypothetical protein
MPFYCVELLATCYLMQTQIGLYILFIAYICYPLWLRTDCQITLTQQLPLALRSVALT